MTKEEAKTYLDSVFSVLNTKMQEAVKALCTESESIEVETTELQKAYDKGFDGCKQAVLEIFGYVMDYWKEHAIDVEPHEIKDALIEQYEFTAKQLSELMPVTSQESITDRVEYGIDGNLYRLTISNGKELKQDEMTELQKAYSKGFETCRQAVLKQLKGCLTGGDTEYNYVKIHIDSILPVNPQEPSVEIVKTEESNDNGTKYLNINVSDNEIKRNPDIVRLCSDMRLLEYVQLKTGHWIYDYMAADGHKTYHCSECGCFLKPKHSEPLNSFKWCSLCGAKMIEPQ